MHISKEKAEKIKELVDSGVVTTLGELAKELNVTVDELVKDDMDD
nr:MAG TPA: Translation initiation factor IF-2, N-terminal region [Caudoviricetes sp.]